MTGNPAVAARKGLLERVLGLFTEVRPGESGTALLLALNVFLLLTTYYIVKPVREALILAGGGAEVKSYAAAGQALLLLGVVPAYAALASRVPRRRLINIVTLFFAACLAGFYLLAKADMPYLGVAFFLWVGIFNLMVIAQFWSFANDVYTPEQGKRLFALVAFGASFGAVAGSWIAERLVEPLGVEQMLVVAAVLLAATLAITNVIEARERNRPRAVAETGARTADEPIPPGGAFQLVLRNRYLLLIAFLMLFLNWVNTTGEYILGRVVREAAARSVEAGTSGGLDLGDTIGKFYAGFFFWVNVVGVLTQLFLVSRILKYLGVRRALLFLPVIALGGYCLLAFYPVLTVVRWAKTAENATDYSLQNTVRNVLFLPTTREQKYKAKQAIDTFFVRAGDLLSAGLVLVGTTVLSFETTHFAVVNLVLVAAWLAVAVAIGRENAKLAGA
ncbi:MAG: NTP/NDP exchange transporter [Candidatus Eiseniibacteriota bacterium]